MENQGTHPYWFDNNAISLEQRDPEEGRLLIMAKGGEFRDIRLTSSVKYSGEQPIHYSARTDLLRGMLPEEAFNDWDEKHYSPAFGRAIIEKLSERASSEEIERAKQLIEALDFEYKTLRILRAPHDALLQLDDTINIDSWLDGIDDGELQRLIDMARLSNEITDHKRYSPAIGARIMEVLPNNPHVKERIDSFNAIYVRKTISDKPGIGIIQNSKEHFSGWHADLERVRNEFANGLDNEKYAKATQKYSSLSDFTDFDNYQSQLDKAIEGFERAQTGLMSDQEIAALFQKVEKLGVTEIYGDLETNPETASPAPADPEEETSLNPATPPPSRAPDSASDAAGNDGLGEGAAGDDPKDGEEIEVKDRATQIAASYDDRIEDAIRDIEVRINHKKIQPFMDYLAEQIDDKHPLHNLPAGQIMNLLNDQKALFEDGLTTEEFQELDKLLPPIEEALRKVPGVDPAQRVVSAARDLRRDYLESVAIDDNDAFTRATDGALGWLGNAFNSAVGFGGDFLKQAQHEGMSRGMLNIGGGLIGGFVLFNVINKYLLENEKWGWLAAGNWPVIGPLLKVGTLIGTFLLARKLTDSGLDILNNRQSGENAETGAQAGADLTTTASLAQATPDRDGLVSGPCRFLDPRACAAEGAAVIAPLAADNEGGPGGTKIYDCETGGEITEGVMGSAQFAALSTGAHTPGDLIPDGAFLDSLLPGAIDHMRFVDIDRGRISEILRLGPTSAASYDQVS